MISDNQTWILHVIDLQLIYNESQINAAESKSIPVAV